MGVRYDADIHQRQSIRLKGYDYSSNGAYFVTICVYDRESVLEDPIAASAVCDAWKCLSRRFQGVETDEFVVMPNHVHGIVVLDRGVVRGGASPAPTLADVVCAFKSISVIAANRALGRSGRPFWQRNYYERVVRNEHELEAIREYVRNNPVAWDEDPNNPANM